MENSFKRSEGREQLRSKYSRNAPSRWKNAGFAALPKSVLFDSRLTKTAVMVFTVLIAYTFEGKKSCFPSHVTIAKDSHASRRSVITALTLLEKLGYLEVEHNAPKGRPNRYFLKAQL